MRSYWHVINFNNNTSSLTKQHVLNTNYFSFFYHLRVNLFKNLPQYKKTIQIHSHTNSKNSHSFFFRRKLLQARISLYNIKHLSFTQKPTKKLPYFTKYFSSLLQTPTFSIALQSLLQSFIIIKGSYFPQYNRELCVDTRWQMQHLTLKKRPIQRRYRKKLKSLRLKKTTLVSIAFKAAYTLYNARRVKSLNRNMKNPSNLSHTLKLNWLKILKDNDSVKFLPKLRTNQINVRLKNTYNWFKEQPYLFLNRRPERPTKDAFLTQSLLFKMFLRFKKTVRKGVLRQKPMRHKFKLKRVKRIFRLKNNLKLLKLVPYRNLTSSTHNTWGIGTKFTLLYNQRRLIFRNMNAISYKAAYVNETSYLNLTKTQSLVNTEQYRNSTTHNLTWWTLFSKRLFGKSPRIVKKYTRTKKWNSWGVYLSNKRFFKFKTKESLINRYKTSKGTTNIIRRYYRFLKKSWSSSLKRQVSRRTYKNLTYLIDDNLGATMRNCFYDNRYNNCKQIAYKLKYKPRNLKIIQQRGLTKQLHQRIKGHYHRLIMSSTLFLNHPGKVSAWILRFLMNSRLLTSRNPHHSVIKTLKYFTKRTRRSHSTLRKTVFSLTKYRFKRQPKSNNRYRLKRYSLKTCYNNMWVFKQLYKRLQLFPQKTLDMDIIKVSNSNLSSVNRYYPTLRASRLYVTPNPKSIQKTTPSVKLRLVNLYNIAFILKPYAFIYTNTPNLNNPRSLVHNKFPMFKYRRYVHSFLYQNEVKRYILKRHRASRSHFGTEPTTDFFDNIRTFRDYVYRYRRVHLNNLTVHTPQQYFNTPDDRSVYTPMHDTLKIKRVRFKPGYYRLWRNARTALKESLNLSFRYQHRLTSYLPRFYKLSKFQTLHAIETKLTSILIYTNLIPDYEFSKYFIDNNLVYVNGIIANQYNEVIVLHDFIQLVVSLKFYIADRWLTNWKLKKQLRLKKLANAKYNNQSFRLDKQSSNKLPKWIYTNKYRFYDVPNYLEVDYFTLSAFTIYDPFLITDFNPVNSREFRVSIYKNYNWKYIT